MVDFIGKIFQFVYQLHHCGPSEFNKAMWTRRYIHNDIYNEKTDK